MTAIDWESKPEPWRSIGRKFAKECQKIMAGYAEPRDKPIAPHVLAGYRLADYRVSRGMTQRMPRRPLRL